jgi:hypothetical protein
MKFEAEVCAELVYNVNITAYTPLPDNTYKRQTPMLLAGFEPAIPASELLQTDALDPVATGDRLWMCW